MLKCNVDFVIGMMRRKHFADLQKTSCLNECRWKFIPLTVCFVEIDQKSPLFTCFRVDERNDKVKKFSIYLKYTRILEPMKGFS